MLNVRNESIIADTSATTSGIRVTDHGSHWYCQGKYDCVGTFSKTSTTVVQITELPLKKWTQDYKEFLAYIRLHICVCVWVWRLYVELLLKCQQYFWISRFCIYVFELNFGQFGECFENVCRWCFRISEVLSYEDQLSGSCKATCRAVKTKRPSWTFTMSLAASGVALDLEVYLGVLMCTYMIQCI